MITDCTVCKKQTNIFCSTCNSAAYCSPACQTLDEPLHSLLCIKIRNFIANAPRPADEYLSTHKLGILFPVDPNTPELIWVKNTIVFRGLGNAWDVSANLKKYIPDATHPLVHKSAAELGDECNVEVYLGANYHGRDPPNECIGHLMKGYQWTDGGSPISEHKWVGAVVVLRSSSYEKAMNDDKKETEDGSKLYEDITLAEFRSALQYFGRDTILYEFQAENPYFFRDESKWIKAVKISCDGDMKILGKKRFRDVMVSTSHRIHNPGRWSKVSAISVHMNIPLVIFKGDFQRQVVDAHNADKRIGAFENPDASVLMMQANVDDALTWGTSESRQWDRRMDSTVLVVRQDKKAICAKQIEGLIDYIKEVEGAAERGGGSPKNVVAQYYKSGKFETSFEEYKDEKIAGGDTTWIGVRSPRAD